MPRPPDVRRVAVPSFAKINLDLRVLYKRPDGFHELRTVFQTISLSDRIVVEYEPAGKSRVLITGNVDIPDNLILSAADAVMRATRAKGTIRFDLNKRIPMGGGLGGGSSNAAAVLLALPVLLGTSIAPAKLHEIASELGSDVPFFLYGGTALGLGRGTEIFPLADAPTARGLVCAPGIHVSTPDAYRELDRPIGGVAPPAFFDPSGWAAHGVNDFEAAVYGRHPELKRIASRLKRAGATTVRMSGSGSSIFSVFSDREMEANALQQVKSLTVHPIAFLTRQRYQSLWWNSLKRHTLVKVWPPQSRYEQ